MDQNVHDSLFIREFPIYSSQSRSDAESRRPVGQEFRRDRA